MFGEIPKDLFRVHDWRFAKYLHYILCSIEHLICRNDVVTIGEVPTELVFEASDGQVNEPWPAQLNKLV